MNNGFSPSRRTWNRVMTVLSGGTYNDAGLRLIGYDRAWLDAQLARRGYARDSLFCVTANEKGQLLLIPNTDKRACEATGGRV